MLYSNFASEYSELRKDAYSTLHDNGNTGYIVMLTGGDFSEQKKFLIRAFLDELIVDDL